MSQRPHGYVLVGGGSRRFGRNKALEVFEGQPLATHVASALAPCCREVAVVGGQPCDYQQLGLRHVSDRRPGQGPLAGLHAALVDGAESGADWVLLASCDRVGLRQSWIRDLCQAARQTPPCDAVAYRDARRWQPMPGLYACSLVEIVEEQLSSEDLALHTVLSRCRVRVMSLPPDWSLSKDVNTPQDLTSAT